MTLGRDGRCLFLSQPGSVVFLVMVAVARGGGLLSLLARQRSARTFVHGGLRGFHSLCGDREPGAAPVSEVRFQSS